MTDGMGEEYPRGDLTMRQLTSSSAGGNSPNLYTTDDATLLVQGYATDDPGVTLDPGEDTVTMPTLLAVDAVAALDPNGMNLTDLFRMLTVCDQSLFRLETRDGYAADRDTSAYSQWVATGRVPTPDEPEMADWVRMVRRHVAASRSMRRVHVVPSDPSAALQFELEMQHACSVPAGEEIRTVHAADTPELAGEDDFWLLDDRVGVRMIYDQDGALTRLDRMTTGEVDHARHIRDRAWSISTDLGATRAPMGVA